MNKQENISNKDKLFWFWILPEVTILPPILIFTLPWTNNKRFQTKTHISAIEHKPSYSDIPPMPKCESERKRNKTKLKSLCPEMLFFFTVIEPSTEREREFKQIQSEILTSYIWYPLLLTLPIGFLRIRLKEVTYLEPPANPKCNTIRNELCCSRGNQTKTIAFSLQVLISRSPVVSDKETNSM